MRHYYGVIVHPDEFIYLADRLCRIDNLDIVMIHPVGGNKADCSLAELVSLSQDGEFRGKVAMLENKGIHVEYAYHALSYLVKRSLFHDHPEWFRKNVENQRTSDINCCPSSPFVLDKITMESEKLAKVLPTADHRYHIWPDDVADGKCYCDACSCLTRSDQNMILANAILKGLKAVDKNASLGYLAYIDTLDPPNQELVNSDVFVEFAPMQRDFSLPLNSLDSAENMLQYNAIDPLMKTFGNKNATVIDYWMDNSLHSNWKKPPKQFFLDEKVTLADMKEYERKGFEYITTFACYLGKDYEDLYGNAPFEGFMDLVSRNSR